MQHNYAPNPQLSANETDVMPICTLMIPPTFYPAHKRTPRRLLPQTNMRGSAPSKVTRPPRAAMWLRRTGELQLPDMVTRGGKAPAVNMPRTI